MTRCWWKSKKSPWKEVLQFFTMLNTVLQYDPATAFLDTYSIGKKIYIHTKTST